MSGETRRAVHRTIFAPSAFYRRREEHMNNGHDTTNHDLAGAAGGILADFSVYPWPHPDDAKTFTDAPPVTRKGRIVKVRSLNSDTADALQRALCEPGVLALLDVVGRTLDLAPSEKRLALMLLGEDL
jgi:hypothetical protein